MFVCPKCGYKEPPIWRNRMWKLYQQYTRIDELEAFEETRPLAEILKKIGPVKRELRVTYSDGCFNYAYKSDGFVIRIPKILARSPDTMLEPDKEKHVSPPHPSQKPLIPYKPVKKPLDGGCC